MQGLVDPVRKLILSILGWDRGTQKENQEGDDGEKEAESRDLGGDCQDQVWG